MPANAKGRKGYKMTKLGWIPEEWDVECLAGLSCLNPRKEKFEGKVSFVPMEDITEDGLWVNNDRLIEFSDGKGYTYFENNDVLVAKITPCFENGKGALVNGLENGRGFGSTEFHVIRVFSDCLDPQFVFYHTRTNRFLKKGELNMTGSAGHKRISLDFIKKYQIPLPPLPEQKKIAKILSTWDKAIERLEQLIEQKQKLKKGLMQQLLTGKKRFDRFEGEWKEVRLGEIGQVLNGLTYTPDDVQGEGTLVLRSSNVQNGRLAFEDNVFVDSTCLKYNPVKRGDILICVRNGSKNLIGKNAMIDKATEGVAFGAFMAIYRSKYNPFLFQIFSSELFKREVHKNLGATINSINGSDLKKFKMPFPSIEEQQKIASVLSGADQEIESLQNQLKKLQEQKKGLMQKLLTGAIRVTI